MRTTKKISLFMALVLIGGCATVQVSQDYDPATDFARYRSFSWAPGPTPENKDVLLNNQFMDRRIRKSVETTLTAKGLSYTPDNQPDILVTYHISVRTRIEVDAYNSGFGWYGYRRSAWGYPYPYWGGIDYQTVVRQYEEGTLIIDFSDARNNTLIWRGIGTRRVTQYSDPEKTTAAVNETVAEILAQYPPPLQAK